MPPIVLFALWQWFQHVQLKGIIDRISKDPSQVHRFQIDYDQDQSPIVWVYFQQHAPVLMPQMKIDQLYELSNQWSIPIENRKDLYDSP